MKRKGVLCFIKQDQSVLLLQIDFGNGSLIWNGISGYVENGEMAEQAVVREAKEEIGIDIDPNSLTYKATQSVSDELVLDVFVVYKWNGEPESQEESIKEIRWFDINKLPYDEMFEGNQEWLPDILK